MHRKRDGFLAPAPQQTVSARVWAVQRGGQINSFHSDSSAAMAALNAVGEEGHGVRSVNSRYVTGLCSTPRWMVLTSSQRSAGPPPCPPPPGLLCPVLPRLPAPPWLRPGLCCRTGWCRPTPKRDTGQFTNSEGQRSGRLLHKHKLGTEKLSGSPRRSRQEHFSCIVFLLKVAPVSRFPSPATTQMFPDVEFICRPADCCECGSYLPGGPGFVLLLH